MDTYKRRSDLAALSGRGKGAVTVAHNLIEADATSSEINTEGYNAIMIQEVITINAKLWTVKLTGSMITGGTFSDVYDNGTLCSMQTNSSKMMLWKGIPQFLKIVATEDEDTGKCTVRYQLMNI
jgi:hypothetical protein